jgi:hypothetical protein
MANTYYDATGELLFDGPAILTPVLCALFDAYGANATTVRGATCYICSESESNTINWHAVAESIAQRQEVLGIAFTPARAAADDGTGTDGDEDDGTGTDGDEDDDVAENNGEVIGWLTALATRFQCAQKPALLAILDQIDRDGNIDLATLFRLACWFNDGHNLKAINFEGCWHCDRMCLYEFGGDSFYVSADFSHSSSSNAASRLALLMQAAFDADDLDSVAMCLLQGVEAQMDQISDPFRRQTIMHKVAAQLDSLIAVME